MEKYEIEYIKKKSLFNYDEFIAELKILSAYIERSSPGYSIPMINIFIRNNNINNKSNVKNNEILEIIDGVLRARYSNLPSDYITKHCREHPYIYCRSIFFFCAIKYGHGFKSLQRLYKWTHCTIINSVRKTFTDFLDHPYYTKDIGITIFAVDSIISLYVEEKNKEFFRLDKFIKDSVKNLQKNQIPDTVSMIMYQRGINHANLIY